MYTRKRNSTAVTRAAKRTAITNVTNMSGLAMVEQRKYELVIAVLQGALRHVSFPDVTKYSSPKILLIHASYV